MVLITILTSVCIALLICIGYFIYDRFQFLQQNVTSLSEEMNQVHKELDKIPQSLNELHQYIEKGHQSLDELHKTLEASPNKIVKSVEELFKEKFNSYFSEAYKIEQGNQWLKQANKEEDDLKQLTLLEQGAKRYPFHLEMHSQLFEMFFNTLDNETALLRRKAILDRMIPISQDYRQNASIKNFEHANGLFQKTEEAAKNLLDDLNQYKSKLVEERLEELFKMLNEIESHLRKSEIDKDLIENLVQRFKELEGSIDKKIVSQDESLAKVYRNISERFAALLRKASTDQEAKKRKEYNLKKLKEIEDVSLKLKVLSDTGVKFSDKKVQDFSKSIFIDKPELASDKLHQYAQSIFHELFTNATRNQRKLMTEVTINLEHE